MAKEAAERDRRHREEVALAERKAKKGQETANIKLGTEDEESFVQKTKKKSKDSTIGISPSLGLGSTDKTKSKTGVQL